MKRLTDVDHRFKDPLIQGCYNRLKYYEDLIDKGMLFIPPAEIDSIVWYWHPEYDPIEEAPFEGRVVRYVLESAHTTSIIIHPVSTSFSWLPNEVILAVEDFGKSIFCTKGEAEIVLQQWRK